MQRHFHLEAGFEAADDALDGWLVFYNTERPRHFLLLLAYTMVAY